MKDPAESSDAGGMTEHVRRLVSELRRDLAGGRDPDLACRSPESIAELFAYLDTGPDSVTGPTAKTVKGRRSLRPCSTRTTFWRTVWQD